MELRVIVIAVASLIVVSLSYVMQGNLQPHSMGTDGGINLIEHSALLKHPHDAPPLSQDVAAPYDGNLLNASQTTSPENGSVDEYDSDSQPQADSTEEENGEPFELDAPLRRKMKSSLPSSSESSQSSDAPSLTAKESMELNSAEGESMLVPDAGLEPLENISLDAESQTDVGSNGDSISISANALLANDRSAVADQLELSASESTPEPFESSSVGPLRDVPDSVNQIAHHHWEYGNSLARRGSMFSARQEFFSGLRLIIESLDLVNGVASHRGHYDLAITALNEAEDFTQAAGDDISSSVSRIAANHQSKILSPTEAQSLTSMAAMQAYFAFSQDHFSAACGHSPVASELLFGLGKLYTVKATQDASGGPIDLAIAILMHQSALNVDSNNFLSANELGVALAKLGHYEPARAALLHSVATKPTPEAWLNLSIVHRQLGETQLAELALSEKQAAEAGLGPESTATNQIRWMSRNEFSSAQQVNFEAANVDAENIPATSAPDTKPKPNSANDSLWSKFKRTLGAK